MTGGRGAGRGRPQRRRHDRRRRAAQDAAPGGDPDHRRRRVDVARQRAGGGRRGAASIPTVLIFGLALSVALMGIAATLYRAAAQQAPLDRLGRAGGHPLRGAAHDLGRAGTRCAHEVAAGRTGGGRGAGALRPAQSSSVTQIGTWSEGFSRERVSASMPQVSSRSAACGVRSTWSMRMPQFFWKAPAW